MTDTMVAKATFTPKPQKTFGESLGSDNLDRVIDKNMKDIKASVENILKKLNINQGGGISSGKDDTRKGVMEALATSSVILFIASVIKDVPVIVGIMKMLKLIIMALFLPLIPILKPVMILLGQFAKFMMNGVNDIGKTLATIAGVAAAIIALASGIALLPALLVAAIAAGLVYLAIAFGQWLRSVIPPEKLWAWIKAPFEGLWNILKIAWMNIVGGLQQLWEKFKAAWFVLSNIGEQVWEWIKAMFVGTIEVGKTIWNWFIGLFKGTINVATTVWNWFKGLFTGGKSGSDKNVGDAIITPGGTVHTDPNDYIIATKNPGALGGGGVVNINIDRPMLTGQADIKTLVKAIEQELYKSNRRYNSYV